MNNMTRKMMGLLMALLALVVGAQAQTTGKLIQVNVGESTILKVEGVIKLAVADPGIADVAPLTEKEVSVIGKKVGATTLSIVPGEGKDTEVYRVEVGNDTVIGTIRRAIAPASINVRMIGDTLILEGEVLDEIESQRAEMVAKAFKPQVVNMLEVKNPRQIKIRVRVAEVNTEATRKIGFRWLDANEGKIGYKFDLAPLDKLFTSASTHGFSGTPTVDVALQLLEEKGWARLLSEPTLITRSGTEASFLAGSEVPIPIISTVGGASTPSVEYKKVGVLMRIKPVADSKNRINTTIHAEVSQPVASSFGTANAPLISTRTADTTLQVADGQTIVIGGLFDNNIDTDTLRKFPWLADIPVIGALFRNKDRHQTQKELVFFMTPSVVKDVAGEVDGVVRTPQLRDWSGEKANKGVLQLEDPKKDWGLHHPNGWGLPDPPPTPPAAPAEPVKEPNKNFTPARPSAP
jgi:pilus assembly protein CpaC